MDYVRSVGCDPDVHSRAGTSARRPDFWRTYRFRGSVGDRHSGNATSLADAPAVGFPVGITVKGGGRTAFDLEFVPQYNATGQRLTTLTVHPGILWGLGKTWAVGLRAAFDLNQPSTGFTPLLHKNFPIRNQHGLLNAYFVEADLPVRFNRPVNQPATTAVTFALHFGVAF